MAILHADFPAAASHPETKAERVKRLRTARRKVLGIGA